MADYGKLIQAGIDMDSLLKRLMGNEKLVSVFIQKFTQDKSFEQLAPAFAAGDMKAAEMASHTLKGMCGNLSITELYELFTKQTNHIRAGECAAAEAMMPMLTELYGRSIDCMLEFLSENSAAGG